MRGLVRTLVVLSWSSPDASKCVCATGIDRRCSEGRVGSSAAGRLRRGSDGAALTEKVRAVVTDGTGQYRIVELPPGRYSVTYTLQGFNVVKREGLVLTGSLTANIDIELRVGELQETVTVTGESPIVDVQSARRQQVIDGDVLNAIPTSRLYNNVLQSCPAWSPATARSSFVRRCCCLRRMAGARKTAG